jgi:hypothetical protein
LFWVIDKQGPLLEQLLASGRGMGAVSPTIATSTTSKEKINRVKLDFFMSPSPRIQEQTGPTRTYRTEHAITRHLLYLLVSKEVTLMPSEARDGQKLQANVPPTA